MMAEDHLYPDGFATPGFEFLSNFYPAPLTVPADPALPAFLHGRRAPTLEHAFQAARCAAEADALAVFEAATPGRAKRQAARRLKRSDWDEVKLEVMRVLLKAKFGEHPDLLARLVDTHPLPITEWNGWHDTFWGKDVRTGIGENRLGRLLEALRAEAITARRSGDPRCGGPER